MFKIDQKNRATYAEVPQANPLRWKTLLKTGENEFIDQSGWIKCKDFYNDTVAFFKVGSVFSIYGYQNNIKKNDEGVYFLLKYIKNKESFFKNLDVMNIQMEKDLGCVVGHWDHEGDEAVVLIPNELWESTYQISMVTMVIRLCNYGVVYKDWSDFWNTHGPSYNPEHAFSEDAKANARKYGFKIPDKFSKYWWYAGKEYNSEKQPKMTGGAIHNNGVSDWSRCIKTLS